MIRYEIRGAVADDQAALMALANHLNSVNLHYDETHIRGLLDTTARSFEKKIQSPWRRRYVFVIVDREQEAIAGPSMIVAQLGRRDAPYIYFDVRTEEKYARTVDRHFHHTILRLGFSYAGPTEIGGLIVDPAYRRVPERLGMLISYVRFLFIASHRELFRDEVLAELLPPLESDGTSHLWQALGHRFTGMTYIEADRLSSENKDFIRDLFPLGDNYTALLSPEARSVIGEVGTQTKGVEKMLRRIGFRYDERVDPFDGGPHFRARTDDVSLVAATRQATIGEPLEESRFAATPALVGRDMPAPPYYRALAAPAFVDGEGVAHVAGAALADLELAAGDAVSVLPLK
jgi:arginine N-succinyltransferase